MQNRKNVKRVKNVKNVKNVKESKTMNMTKLARLLTFSVVLAAVSGCMGSFVLTKKLYGWNESVTGNKIVNNLIFWGLNIVPVYSLAVAGDALILNLIEFWTGNKMIADASDAAGADDGRRVAVVENEDGTLTVTRGGERFVLVPRGADRLDIVVDGAMVGSAERTATGGVVAFDAQGRELGVVTPEEAELGARLAAAALAGE